MSDKNVDGFSFQNAEDADVARQELHKIKYISEKMMENNPEAVLAVYNKIIQSNIFITPVGYEYLRDLQSYLYKSTEIQDTRIQDIPLQISYSEASRHVNTGNDLKTQGSTPKKKKNYKQEYKFSLAVSAVLVLMVIAMFVIALKSDNPNILNYKTVITNQYSEWEQELTEREAAVREKEAELEKEK